ncbi:hypothetical protein SCUCBS95973_006966 [Sporothrix curviconia]|uniref:Uncharacterized protein n=1 Tax=Sporothrix curviconia TaxID=1260050 RepID=A0ABP0CBR7_9PEZI
MAPEASGLLDSWLLQLLGSIFFPQSPYLAVRIISGVFAALGIAFIFPIICLVVFDVGLWFWRLYSANRNAFLRQQQEEHQEMRLLREQRRLLREQLQKSKADMARQPASPSRR